MDCLAELHTIEEGLNGTLEEMGAIIATVQDPIERMVLAVAGAEQYRNFHQSEALNFSLSETVWRLAMTMNKAGQ